MGDVRAFAGRLGQEIRNEWNSSKPSTLLSKIGESQAAWSWFVTAFSSGALHGFHRRTRGAKNQPRRPGRPTDPFDETLSQGPAARRGRRRLPNHTEPILKSRASELALL